MQEHELKEYHRLRAEGKWNAAYEFREAERLRLRAAGRTRQQARDESWEAMLEEYPPEDEEADDTDDEPESVFEETSQNASFEEELTQLARLTGSNPTDADGDIDFAYRNMALPTVTPLMAPSISAWSWYLYSRSEPNKFLEICAKREDAKAKMAGTITNQMMEDDKRKQFAMIDRIEKELTLDVTAIIKELMEKFPEDVARECRKHTDAWTAFFAAKL